MAAGGVAQIPWYATLFRGDKFELALLEIAPVALRYGATEWDAVRARDDTYKFVQSAVFEDKLAFERYWLSDEFVQWRGDYSSWYQVPVVYGFWDRLGRGSLGGGQSLGRGEQEQTVA
jgi:hypothetical protein